MRESTLSKNCFLKNTSLVTAGLVCGVLASNVIANLSAPTEHKGLEVKALGHISGDSMSRQLGLSGYKLQLREITILPGGQIARHDHFTRPGLVKVVGGTWIEGRPGGETGYSPSDDALLEDYETEHWFFNRGDSPATAYVCDIVPES